MSLRKFVPLLIAASVVSITGAMAQSANSDFKLTKVTPELFDTPTPNSGGNFNKKANRPAKWLEVETSFDWQPRLGPKDPKFLDELTVTYYILLNNANTNVDRQPTLLVGTVTHVNIMPGRDLHSSVYVAPRTLEKYLGAAPNNAAAAVLDVGVTLTSKGQPAGEIVWKGKGAWWTNPQYKQVQGDVLTKNDTPFAHLSWDYFEPIKTKTQ